MVAVVKTLDGGVPAAGQFHFEIRMGASPTEVGTIKASAVNDANGNTDFGGLKLAPGTYQFCETMLPAGFHSSVSDDPNAFVPNSDDPMVDNSVVCVPFTLDPGETEIFHVDNTSPPEGDARTIGFWRNWASCSSSKGKQMPVLDQTLASFPIAMGQTTHGLFVGDLYVDTCLKGVRLLNKSTVNTGTKKASDPAFNLAAQLLAAQLNKQAGAEVCMDAADAISAAQAQLDALNFNGITHLTISASLKTTLNNLATTLDQYNNNILCP